MLRLLRLLCLCCAGMTRSWMRQRQPASARASCLAWSWGQPTVGSPAAAVGPSAAGPCAACVALCSAPRKPLPASPLQQRPMPERLDPCVLCWQCCRGVLLLHRPGHLVWSPQGRRRHLQRWALDAPKPPAWCPTRCLSCLLCPPVCQPASRVLDLLFIFLPPFLPFLTSLSLPAWLQGGRSSTY